MIVVTGGAGFIGSCMLWKLNEMGITDILVVDELGHDDKWRNLSGKKITDYMHHDDFPAWLRTHGEKVTTIFHMGACSATTETDVDYLMRVNFGFSKAMWEWGVAHEGQLIYASSAATYGDGEQGYGDGHERVETLRPLNPYGYSKQLFDQWALAQAGAGRAPAQWVGLKFFNVYGPNEYHKGSMASVIWHAFGQARDDGEVRLFKSHRDGIAHGDQKRDFIYVKDGVAVMAWLMENRSVSGLFNLGTGTARSFADLASATIKAMEGEAGIRYIDMPEEIRDRYQYFTEADVGKLRKAGYRAPFTSLEDGVADYVKGYLETPEPYL